MEGAKIAAIADNPKLFLFLWAQCACVTTRGCRKEVGLPRAGVILMISCVTLRPAPPGLYIFLLKQLRRAGVAENRCCCVPCELKKIENKSSPSRRLAGEGTRDHFMCDG